MGHAGSVCYPLKELEAAVEGLVEAFFLALKGGFDGVGFGGEFGEDGAELFDEGVDELGEEGSFAGESEVTAVADGAAQDTAKDVVAAVVAGEDAVGDGEGEGADVVGDYTEGDGVVKEGFVGVGSIGVDVVVGFVGEFFQFAEVGGEGVGVVVGGFL